MKKTRFNSFCSGSLCKGCQLCVQGKKLVLFISGRCSRNCWYCSLSDKRKNTDKIYANEREIRNIREILEEARDSRATSAGITGGDPLLFINRTIKLCRELKNKFGAGFHIHIYLPTSLVTLDKMKKLSKYVDEFRFHPSFLVDKKTEDLEKIKQVSNLLGKSRVGLELPMIPDRKSEILKYILEIKSHVSFVNLNEFELSETNKKIIQSRYNLSPGGYTVKSSITAGKQLIKELEKRKARLKVHLCTAELKNWHQFRNRLRRHKILKYGQKTQDGTVIYYLAQKKHNLKDSVYDSRKKRTILSKKTARRLLGKVKIERVEEYPTFDRIEVEKETF